MVAQGVVQAGHQWQIGNGATVGIWHDKWLPKLSIFWVTSPQSTSPKDPTVNALINTEIREWKTKLIHRVFLPNDTNTILSIQLSRCRPVDHLVWAYTPKGTFSVNSAYKVALSLTLATTSGSTFNSQNKSSSWHTVWGLNIPKKIKTFMWKAY